MRNFTRCLFLTVLALLLSACAPEMLPPEDPVPQATPMDTQPAAPPGANLSATPSGLPLDQQPQAVQAAIRSLSQLLSIQAAQIELISAEQTMWPDSCLGLAAADEMCLQVITPGYRVVLKAGDQESVVHTDETGENLRHAPAMLATPKAGETQAEVIMAAVRALNIAHDLGSDLVEVVSIERVEWPDACLGLPAPGEACAEAITPGYRIILSSAGQEFEVHTDATGASVRLAPSGS